MVRFDFLTDFVHFIGAQIVDAAVPVDAGSSKDFQGSSPADAINIGKCDIRSFTTGQFNACNSGHVKTPARLALALFMPGVFADHSQNTLAPDNLALRADFFDGRPDFHRSLR